MAICLVTGAAGFIGSTLSERLVQEGHTVVGIDCFADYYPRKIKERNLEQLLTCTRFMFLKADLLGMEIPALLEGQFPVGMPGAVDYVFHLAAQPGVLPSWGEDFDAYTRNNILVTQRLLEGAKHAMLRKLVYASSSSVYGSAESYPTPESATPHPFSPYGVSKLAGEHLCLLYHHNYGIPAVCLRYFTVYGPRQRPDMAFHRFIRAVLKGEAIPVYGNGKQTRDFTFVSDAVEGTLRAAQLGVPGTVFNLGGGSRVSVNEVIQTLEDIANVRVRVRSLDPQPGDVHDTSADISRATAELGYMPCTSLSNGLRRELEWMQQQEIGCS